VVRNDDTVTLELAVIQGKRPRQPQWRRGTAAGLVGGQEEQAWG
jgi:hypothetical protein